MGNDDGENGEEIHHEFDLSSSLSDVGLVLLPFCVCSPWAFVSYEGRFLCVCVCVSPKYRVYFRRLFSFTVHQM